MISLALAALLASSTCAAGQEAPGQLRCVPRPESWQTIATPDDRARLRGWRGAWEDALEQARAGHGAEIAAEGALLQPDAALPQPTPPAGDYVCRTIKLGTLGSTDMLTYVAYPAFRCRIAGGGGRMTLTKLTGSQRPIGRLFSDNERRLIFLGTMQLGDETRTYGYGVDRERDLIGILERVGEQRWRLVFPSPHHESLLDVVELTP